MVLVEMGTTIMGWEIKLNGDRTMMQRRMDKPFLEWGGGEGGEIFMFLPFFRLFLRRKEKPGEGIIRTHALLFFRTSF